MKERPMKGVFLKNSSASRVKLSPSDYAGDLKSYVSLARAETHQGEFLDWVWEDVQNVTVKTTEDLSSQITGTDRLFTVSNTPIVSGPGNIIVADNFRQVELTLDGEVLHAEDINGKTGSILVPYCPAVGQTLLATYYYKNLTPPGRYYVELISTTQYVIDPLYIVEDEVVINKTTGLELTASLDHGGLYGDFDVLYTKKNDNSNEIVLVKGDDYTITTGGLITFNNPLISDSTLYANYRWVGSTLGPFLIPDNFHYDNKNLQGIILAFSGRKVVGDKAVIIVYPDREQAAMVYSAHWRMTFDIDVFSRDPMELAELTDFVVDDMWTRKRQRLISAGLTMEELEPSGESEDPYDANTTDLYYHNSINMVMMTEWKKIVPYVVEIMDFDTKLYMYMKYNKYLITEDGRSFDLILYPVTKEFEVKYPSEGFPRYY
jgi:hypothetical protein